VVLLSSQDRTGKGPSRSLCVQPLMRTRWQAHPVVSTISRTKYSSSSLDADLNIPPPLSCGFFLACDLPAACAAGLFLCCGLLLFNSLSTLRD
jgi:hypothetical protein